MLEFFVVNSKIELSVFSPSLPPSGIKITKKFLGDTCTNSVTVTRLNEREAKIKTEHKIIVAKKKTCGEEIDTTNKAYTHLKKENIGGGRKIGNCALVPLFSPIRSSSLSFCFFFFGCLFFGCCFFFLFFKGTIHKFRNGYGIKREDEREAK